MITTYSWIHDQYRVVDFSTYPSWIAGFGEPIIPITPPERTVIINSDGVMHGLYPSNVLYPSDDLYPGSIGAPPGRSATILPDDRRAIIPPENRRVVIT